MRLTLLVEFSKAAWPVRYILANFFVAELPYATAHISYLRDYVLAVALNSLLYVPTALMTCKILHRS